MVSIKGGGAMNIEYITKAKSPKDIYQLYEELGWNRFLELSQEALVKAMENSYKVIYAYDGPLLIGTARIISDGVTNAYFCGLGVKQTHRGKGVARTMTSILRKECSEEGLHFQFFVDHTLVPYYEKQGYKHFAVGMK